MRLYFIRHGETRLNQEGRLQGRVDEPLNDKGRELAVITGEALKDVPFDLIITSPLCRAKETGILAAKASAGKQGREIPVIEDDRILEIDWGNWDCHGILPGNFSVPTSIENFNLFFSNPFAFEHDPEGESIMDVIIRTGDFLQDIIHRPEYQDKTILISTHGCALRAMLNPLYEDPSDFWQRKVPGNCAVSIVEVEDGVPKLVEKDVLYYDESLSNNLYAPVEE